MDWAPTSTRRLTRLRSPGAAQSHMAEFFGSGRQSRLSMLAEGNLNSAKVSWLLRVGLLVGWLLPRTTTRATVIPCACDRRGRQAALNSGWTFTGGQMWSLVTETKKGVDNRSEALPMTIDPQYTVGFSWARQYAFRVSKDLSRQGLAGFSVENSQETIWRPRQHHQLPARPARGERRTLQPNRKLLLQSLRLISSSRRPSSRAGDTTKSSALLTDFRDRDLPAGGGRPSRPLSGAYNNSAVGGGIGANMRGTIAKHFDVGLHFLGGNGIGRYGTAGLVGCDCASRRRAGSGQELSNAGYSGMAWPEVGCLRQRWRRIRRAETAFVNSSGKGVGYGSPLFNNSGCYTETPPAATTVTVVTPITTTAPTGGTASIPVPGAVGTPLTNGFNPGGLSNCNGDTRNIIEGTLGFWYRFYNGPKGRVQWGPQYSYVVRNTWSGVGGNPSATENMFFTSFRYYLP